MTWVVQARKHFFSFEETATDSESPLHSTYIHATSLPPKMLGTFSSQDGNAKEMNLYFSVISRIIWCVYYLLQRRKLTPA